MVATTREPRLPPLIAAAAAVLVGTELPLPAGAGVTAGSAVALALAPVCLPFLWRTRGAAAVAVSGTAAAALGLGLTAAAGSGRTISFHQAAEHTSAVLGVVLALAVLLWARSLLGAPAVAAFAAVGMLAALPITGLSDVNVWRFSLSIPLTILILAIAAARRSRRLELAALVALTAVTAANDARSATVFLVLTAAIVCWQLLPLPASGRRRPGWAAVSLLGMGAAIVAGGQALILSGALGEATRQRTLAQLQLGDSLLAGGRPEMGATLALVERAPLGLGAGTVPGRADIEQAKAGMRALGYDPDNGYVENYMFGSGVELHSMLGDLWVGSGLAGILFALVLAALALRHVAGGMLRSAASALAVYLAIRLAWNLLFSPLDTSALLTVLLLVLVLPTDPPAGRPPRPAPDLALAGRR